jgi:hypothetical protein
VDNAGRAGDLEHPREQPVTRPRIRPVELIAAGAVVVAVVVIFALAGGSDAPANGLVDVRNGSDRPVTVAITEGGFLFFQGTARYQVEPWTTGQCLVHIRVQGGEVAIRVVGPRPGQETTSDTRVQPGSETHITVDVAADGTVRFGGPLPPEPSSCGAEGG